MVLIRKLTSIWFFDRCPRVSIESSLFQILSQPWIKAADLFNKALTFLSLFFLAFYRSLGTAWVGGVCRFEPSCSDYATKAFQSYSFSQALYLSIKRLARCRPGGGQGYDPVPENLNRHFNCRGQHGTK